MNIRSHTRRGTIAVIVRAAIAAGITCTLLATPAHAGTTGLYGSSDPTYDGVFRQSLAILGLTANGIQPSPTAIRWLTSQQCADGSFQPYRASLSEPCDENDATTLTGPDTNATALATLALNAVGEDAAATRAAQALLDAAQTTGRTTAWSFAMTGSPDAASTGLVLAALQAVGSNSATIQQGKRWLTKRAIACPRVNGGALSFDAGTRAANNFASAKGMLGLTTALPITGKVSASDIAANPRCGGPISTRVASYLASALKRDGILQYSGYGGDDYGSTAAAVLALGSAETGRTGRNRAVTALRQQATDWVGPQSETNVGAAGWLLMVAAQTGSNPRSFGGVDLVRAVTGSMR